MAHTFNSLKNITQKEADVFVRCHLETVLHLELLVVALTNLGKIAFFFPNNASVLSRVHTAKRLPCRMRTPYLWYGHESFSRESKISVDHHHAEKETKRE